MNGLLKPKTNKLLIFIPILTYVLSYIYLAIYHQKIWLFNTIVHESGKYTLIQDIFYASHFLGHIPVHIVLSLILVGSLIGTEKIQIIQRRKTGIILLALIIFLILSYALSLQLFGFTDTWLYIRQQKQSVVNLGQGGSWNLHLPSTLLQFLLIPIYAIITKWFFKIPVYLNKKGSSFIIIAGILFLALTFIINKSFWPIYAAWLDPRYLAHSIRELVTFPLTYYPIPLYFIFRNHGIKTKPEITKKLKLIFIGLLSLFVIGFAYQILISLNAGVGEIAQKPDFAKNGSLSIFYLLASHYFEHFLDTIFFSLFTLYLYRLYNNYVYNK